MNIADSCSGASIGLFNYIKNGINSFSVFFENGQVGLQYQGGTKAFFTTFMANIDKFSEESKYYVLGYGIGSEFGGSFINFDFEVLGKYILDKDYLFVKYNNIGTSAMDDSLSGEEVETFARDFWGDFSKRFYCCNAGCGCREA